MSWYESGGTRISKVEWRIGSRAGEIPKMMFCAMNQYSLQLNRNWGQGRSRGGGGGGCRTLVSDGRGNDFECPPPPLTPTPASPLTLLANWRTHFYVRLLTSSGASGFWSISQKCVMCSQAWNDIHQIWYQKNQKELIYKMISLIPIFRAYILNKRWFPKCKVFFDSHGIV